MRSFPLLAAAALAACTPAPPPAEAPAPGPAAIRPGLDWQKEASGPGFALRLSNLATGAHLLTVSCVPPNRLVVRAPSFTPISSEDRFSFGVGGEPVTLVANPYEQTPGAGVVAEGPVPAGFAALWTGADRISALYGTQQVGPHVAPPEPLRRRFLAACPGPDGG